MTAAMANHYQPRPAKARALACHGQQRLWPYMAMAWALGLGPEHGPWLAMANHDLTSACNQLCSSKIACCSWRGGVALYSLLSLDRHAVFARLCPLVFARCSSNAYVQIESYVYKTNLQQGPPPIKEEWLCMHRPFLLSRRGGHPFILSRMSAGNAPFGIHGPCI